MNKYYLLFLILVLGASFATAQVHLGVSGYAQKLSLNGDSPEDQIVVAELGYGAGLSLGYFILPEIQLTLGATYDVRNNQVSKILPITDSLVPIGNFRLTSYAVPVGVRIFGGSKTWYFSSGVTLRFHGNASVNAIDSDSSYSVSSAFVKVEGSLYLGFGYMFKIGNMRVVPELRYEQGLSNILNGEPLATLPPSPTLRSTGFSFRLFAEYAFGGGQ
ncbi:MAG: hypothetical protein NTX15_06765 [Candidatus Kapabacteria bacterium]|nr:hypothetical protein [Candidatus Kapabacteria bacterium]